METKFSIGGNKNIPGMKFLFHAGVSLFSGVIVGKCLPQFADGIRQMGFQSLDGDVEDGGHFFIFEFVFVDEFESHFTFGGKRVDSLVQAADTFPADKFFFGSRFSRGEKVDGDFVQRDLLHVLFAVIADRFVAGYRVYVGIEIGDAGKLLAVVPDSQESVGNDLFGFSRR